MVLFLRAFHDLSAPIMPYCVAVMSEEHSFGSVFLCHMRGQSVCVCCVCAGGSFAAFALPGAPRDGWETEPDGGWPLESVSFVVCVEESKPQGGCICDKTGAEF